MRITCLLFIIGVLQTYAIGSYAQITQLTIHENEIDLGELFEKIEEQTDFYFFYSNDQIDKNQKVKLDVNDKTITEILDIVLSNTGITYRINNKAIILNTRQTAGLPHPHQTGKLVTGVITDESGETIIGANIMEKGTNNGVVTDMEGRFSIQVGENAILEISYIGYTRQEVIVGERNTLSIILKENAVGLEEVVVIGYTTQKKELLTGSVVNLKMDEALANTPTTSVGNILAGKLAGVTVNTPDGLPGNQPGVSVRNRSSWNEQPVLYVIDGKISTESDFNSMSPNDIDNISVLKDAASTAIYGSRAAGGVILVTTKRGGYNQKVRINYSFNTGFDKRGKNVKLTDGAQTAELYQRINPTSDPAGWAWTDDDIEFIKTVNGGWGYDLLKSVWRDPHITTHNVDISGGTDKIKFFAGGSFVNQKGFLPNLDYKKNNLRINVSAKLSENLHVFAGISLNDNSKSSTSGASVGDIYGLYQWLLNWQPDYPVWTNGGLPIDIGWTANIAAQVRGDGGYIRSNQLKPVINASLTYRLPVVKGLSVGAAYSKSYTNDRTKTFLTRYKMYATKKTGNHIFSIDDADIIGTAMSSQISKDYMEQESYWNGDWQMNFQINYDRTFNNDHSIKAALVFEKYEVERTGFNGKIESFPIYLTDQWWAASSDRANSEVSTHKRYSDYVSGRQSWIGQLFYDYQNKYLASFSYRYDGSMNFAPDKRWGFFPSASLGWIISREPFFQIQGIDLLKLRGSAGLTGNDAVGRDTANNLPESWQWQQTYVSGNPAYFGTGSTTNQGITYGILPNENLTWEKSLNYNAGVDVYFLNAFNFSAEYYFTKTTDVLGPRQLAVPPTFSLKLPDENYGEFHSSGVEFSLGYGNTFRDFNVFGSIVAAYGDSKYVIYDDDKVTYDYQKKAGRSMSAVYGYVADRIIRDEADLEKYKAEHPGYNFNGYEPQPGQLVYKDISGPDGTPDGIINQYDIAVLKKRNNPIVLGLTLGAECKGLAVSAVFNGNLKYYRWMRDIAGGTEWNRMWVDWYHDSWTPENTNASLPKRLHAYDNSATYHNESSFWLKRGDFLRLKNLNVSYTIPQKIYNRIGVNKVSVYFVGTNMFVMSSFNKKYYDPEMSGGFTFPIMKSYNFGINVTL